MNNLLYENNNHVLLKGKIKELPTYSHTVMGEGFFEMYVEVKRLSDETDVLPVTISERLIASEKQVSMPYVFVGGAILLFAILLFIVPVASVRFTAINILIALVVTVYTSMIIGPGVYASLLEMREMNRKAVLSRNDTVNKEIKKKVRKATKEASKN